MPRVKRRVSQIIDYETEVSQEHYDLYKQSPDEFWDLFYSELIEHEEEVDLKELDEWVDIDE